MILHYPQIVQRIIWGFLLLHVFIGKRAESFNLDIITPIVKYGPNESYFGFSVAQHSITAKETSIPNEHIFLVGAPKDYTINKPEVRGGRLYKCSFTSLENDCSPVDIDLTDSSDAEKHDQWLGATVSSQRGEDGAVVVCAPRKKRVQPASVHGPGVCLLMTNELKWSETFEICSGRSVGEGHGEFGFCQVGYGLDIAKDGELLVGAPGVYTWQGMVFQKFLSSDLDVDTNWANSLVGDLKYKEFGPESATKFYSYLGMSAKIAKINGEKTYVVGAPRSLETGQVLLFKRFDRKLKVEDKHYLTGNQFGSGFGYEVLVMDFNSDSSDDLVIGAPFEHGDGIGGAIYIYKSDHQGIDRNTKARKIQSRKMTDTECIVMNCKDARFGYSLADAGDLDGDGFHDLIVGAPYEGQGAIYVFQGSSLGLIETYSQRIISEDFGRIMPTFGYSITGGVDMDSSGSPDVIVGAYKSAAAVVFRSRPVIDVQASVSTDPSRIDMKSKQCHGRPCFHLKVCFTLKSNRKNMTWGNRRIEFVIELESETIGSRIQFKGAESKSRFQESVPIPKENKPECYETQVFLNENNKDLLNPIVFKLSYQLDKIEHPILIPGGRIDFINRHPILNHGNSTLNHMVHFKKNCVNEIHCISNLKVKGTLKLEKTSHGQSIVSVGRNKDLFLEVHIQNDEEEAHEAMLFVTLPPLIKFKGTDEKGKKYSCEYVSNIVTCLIGNPMPGGNVSNFGMRLDPSGLDPSMQNVNITLAVNTTSLETNSVDDTDVLHLKIIVEAELQVRGVSSPSELYFGGVVKGEGAMKFDEEIGSEVIHSYEVKNLEGGLVRKISLNVFWPSELNETNMIEGKHLLYLMDVQTEGQIICNVNESRVVNPLRILTSRSKEGVENKLYRQKRRLDDYLKKPFREGRMDKVAELDCKSGTAKCANISCVIENLEPGQSAVVKFIARLWNSTFLQDFMNVDKVRIFSSAHIKVDSSLNVRRKNTKNDRAKTITIVLPDQDLNKPHEVDLWIIILSICAGVLLLLLLIFLLWKCGFFIRNKPEDALVHQAKLINQPH